MTKAVWTFLSKKTSKFGQTVTPKLGPKYSCYNVAAIAAEWQEWGQWSECTASCGQGLKIRARACRQLASGGNEQCPGDSTEVEDCSSAECPGELILWLPDLLGQKPFVTFFD